MNEPCAPSRVTVPRRGNTTERFHAELDAGRIAPATANRVIQDLARLLVPINCTREARFRHDPALTIAPLPTLSAAGELDRFDNASLGFAQTQLTRGQNRLVAALHAAQRHIDLVTA